MSIVQEKSSNEKESEVYFNFINSIRSEVTKEIYGYNIKVFMKSCNVESFYDLFTMSNPQAQIIKHLTSLSEKGLSSNSISTRLKMQFKPAKIYCDGSNPNFIKSLKSIFNEA